MRGEYDRRRQLIVSGFNTLGLDCFEPRGAFYAFPSIARTGMTGDEFAMTLLEEEEVAMVGGEASETQPSEPEHQDGGGRISVLRHQAAISLSGNIWE